MNLCPNFINKIIHDYVFSNGFFPFKISNEIININKMHCLLTPLNNRINFSSTSYNKKIEIVVSFNKNFINKKLYIRAFKLAYNDLISC